MRAAWRPWLRASLAAATLLGAAAVAARADSVAQFYAGKTVRILVGFGPGGGYDLYARTLARYLAQHIPGEPAIVVQNIFPVMLRNLFHLPMRLVAGYQGGADMVLAMERREIDGRCGWSWTSLVSRNKAMLDAHAIAVTLQIALAPHEDLPDVPLVMDLVRDPQQLAALKLIVSRQSIARPFAAPPEVPAARVAALRSAFDAVMRDPDFRAEAKRLALEVRPVGGRDVQALLGEVYAAPPGVVARASELIREAP